jgi:copper homeostasis protein
VCARESSRYVLVRPRGGDFVYSADEEDVMTRDIRAVREAGADGVVIAVPRPLSTTFHRAFDETADPAAAFTDVLELGADRLLTSGGAPTALEGADVIRSLTDRSDGRIIVMADCGAGRTGE